MLQNISISLSNKLDFLIIRNFLKSHGFYRIKQLNIYKKTNQHIRMISEGSRGTEE